MEFDDSVIPKGDYCYTIVYLKDGEPPLISSERFGFEVREAAIGPHAKRILCPHWQRTTHGTVRCQRIGRETAIGRHNEENVALAIAYFGSKEIWKSQKATKFDLVDEQKICDINLDEEDEDD